MRKLIAVALVAMAIVALSVASAFAEGYNNPTGTGDYTQATGYFSGPHGGYTTTTNKCQDCHSTHYAFGSYKLLRANTAEAACDFCHGGGGGSTINVMMDNAYQSVEATFGTDAYAAGSAGGDKYDAVAIASGTNGPGTGHTLGFTGNAPADVQPAYSAGEGGFACFSCHSPHGNSARILTTFANPGRSMGTGAAVLLPSAAGYISGPNIPGVSVASTDGTLNSPAEWGIDPNYGNLKWFSSGAVASKPIWPSGRFLLLKNPHAESVADTVVAAVGGTATGGVNKYAVNWDEPLGPADGTYGGGQNNDNDKSYPIAPQVADSDGDGKLEGGFLALSEFCVDCHDGTGGVSTQRAEVWNGTSYVIAYSHDAQPRH
jgi:hypothetical protein